VFSFADCLETYGAKVTPIGAPVGGRPSIDEIEAALKKDKYSLLTFTHVDTCASLSSSHFRLQELTMIPLLQQRESSRTPKRSANSLVV
jgi:alanine-glyoxylate transaminase/serine-glyoxylate transaminase/serine-pyruvate transaminase